MNRPSGNLASDAGAEVPSPIRQSSCHMPFGAPNPSRWPNGPDVWLYRRQLPEKQYQRHPPSTGRPSLIDAAADLRGISHSATDTAWVTTVTTGQSKAMAGNGRGYSETFDVPRLIKWPEFLNFNPERWCRVQE
ncbi:hypothetical protein AVEN_106690-1 [Araneus ventricosus]|uniref:Uncharacterized protein n=1 Tax=Araneus ventricosus TaxID=182803 RepID=A0A4Y2LM80_ARAVE|nr:hypothetical protein AVEN_106690-1 [Araneus ventricosus]